MKRKEDTTIVDKKTDRAKNIYIKLVQINKEIETKSRTLKNLTKGEKRNNTIKQVQNKIVELRKTRLELLSQISKPDRTRIISEAYKRLFEDDLGDYNRISSKIKIWFTPEFLLLKQFKRAEELEKLIEQPEPSSKDVDEFFELQKKINSLLIVLKNLDLNIPAKKKKVSVNAQVLAIKTPILAAEALSKRLLKTRSNLESRFNKTENSIEQYITYRGYKVIRKKILAVPSFNSGKNSELEEEMKSVKKENLHIIFAKILNNPFKIVESLRLDPSKKENHPKKILRKMHSGKLQNLDVLPQLEDAIHKHELLASLLNMEFSYWRRFALLNLETIKSVMKKLNPTTMRAITFEETQIIPGAIDKQLIKEKIEEDRSKNEDSRPVTEKDIIDFINKNFIKTLEHTFMYEENTWTVGEGPMGEQLTGQGVTTAFTSYNRNLKTNESLNMSIPSNEFAILKPSDSDSEKFDVSLNRYNLNGNNEYRFYHERMLEIWINTKGNKKETKKQWKREYPELQKTKPSGYPPELINLVIKLTRRNIVSENRKEGQRSIFLDSRYIELVNELKRAGIDVKKRYIGDLISEMHSKSINGLVSAEKSKLWWKKYVKEMSVFPSFDEILTDVYTLPCVLLSDQIYDTHSVNDLQEQLTKKTNALRSNFATASMLLTFGIDKHGNIAISSNHDHSQWDGGQSGDMVEKMLSESLDINKDYLYQEQKSLTTNIIPESETQTQIITGQITSSIPTEKIVSKEDPESQNLLKKEGNHQFQSYAKAEGLFKQCDSIGGLVRKMTNEGKIHPDSKLKNPAVVMQLILIHHYREILFDMKDEKGQPLMRKNKNIGMLIGNSDITKDLDLAPIGKGFNLNLFLTLNNKQKETYLLNKSLLLDIALANTNMSLIKKVANYIPNETIQNKLNDLSRIKPLLEGLRDLSDVYMISSFGLPWYIDGDIIIKKINGFNVIRISGPAQADMQKGSMTVVGAVIVDGEFYLSICYKNEVNEHALTFAEEMEKIIERYNDLM